MNTSHIIENIIRIPSRYKVGNQPFTFWATDSGYFSISQEITIEEIASALRLTVDCVGDWLAWSANKRTVSGWFFEENPNGSFVVGYHGKEQTSQLVFNDLCIACATYIKKEMEEIRQSI